MTTTEEVGASGRVAQIDTGLEGAMVFGRDLERLKQILDAMGLTTG